MHLRPMILLSALALGALAQAASAQEPARRWERRGFEFSRDGVWRRRARAVLTARQAALGRSDVRALNAPLAARQSAMVAPGTPLATSMAVPGTLHAPAFLVTYNETRRRRHFPAEEYQAVLFGDSATIATFGRPFSLRTFYEQLSNGLFSIQGQVVGWTSLDSSDTWYEGPGGTSPCSGLCSRGHVAQLIREAVQKNDAAVDYGQFDNDGADGVANSGDDDGVVDVAVLVHPEVGAECNQITPGTATNIWSHRHSYAAWTSARLVTADPRRDQNGVPIPGQYIAVDDYIIQGGVGGATACESSEIMAIGTVAHELGHGLGLPDLYDTFRVTEGIGGWGLMSAGGYDRPLSPAHLEGFSRLQLGWVSVVDATVDATYTVGPYATADTIFRVTPTGSNPRAEFFLIENRQGVLSDTALTTRRGAGMLIYHVDTQQYNAGYFSNTVNAGAIHGLWLLQADGLNQLRDASCEGNIPCRGDAGDPFPGTTGNTALSYATNPSNRLNSASGFPGFAIDSIRTLQPGGPMAFRLTFLAPLVAADTVLTTGTMGVVYADTLSVTGGGGAGTYVFAVTAGALPPGLALMANTGALGGIAERSGTYSFTVSVSSAGSGVSLPLRIVVGTPQLTAQAIEDQLLRGGTYLTAEEQRYMDLVGNDNTVFDVGDVAAWLDRNPDVPLTPALRRFVARAR